MTSQLELSFDPSGLFKKVTQAHAEADVIFLSSKTLNFKVSKGNLEAYKVNATSRIGIRVIHNERVGIAYSESFDTQSLSLMVDQALENAAISKKDSHQILPNKSILFKGESPSAWYQPEVASESELLEQLKALESQVLSHKYVKSCPHNGLTTSQTGCRIWSSHGLDVQSLTSTSSAFIYALAEANGHNSMEGGRSCGRTFADLDLNKLAQEVQTEAIQLLDGAPVTTGTYDVILSADCLAQLFQVFSMIFSGKSALDGLNPWRNRLAQSVAFSELTIIDKPSLPSLGQAVFDSEGVACQDTVIVQEGILKTLLHNTATAQELNINTTGNGSRSTKSPLSVEPHQLCLARGMTTVSSLQAGQYLEITSLTGTHSGANSVSCDFSFGAAGYLCRNGVRQQPVRGITLAANFYELLHKIAIGDDHRWDSDQQFLAPSVRLQGVCVAGS